MPNRLPTHYLWLALALVVALGYLFDLGGDHIPRNGDELVYEIGRASCRERVW